MNALSRGLYLRLMILRGDPCVWDRWRWLAKRLQKGSIRTLDAGCGGGDLTAYAASKGNDALGLSNEDKNTLAANKRAAKLGLPRLRFNTVDLRHLEKHTKQLGVFDQIICFEVIEHIKDDKAVVKALAHMLPENGTLLLTTPNKHYKPLLGDKLSATEDGGHVRWGYTHEELRKLAREAGLDVIEESFISGYVSQKLTNCMRIIRNATGSPALAWLLIFPWRIFQILNRPLTAITRYPPLSVAIVAKKK